MRRRPIRARLGRLVRRGTRPSGWSDELGSRIGTDRASRVAVLVDAGSRARGRALLAQWRVPHGRLLRTRRVRSRLDELAPLDVVVDLRGGPELVRTFEDGLFRLRHGGVYVVPLDVDGAPGLAATVGSLVARPPGRRRRPREVARAIGGHETRRGALWVTKHGDHLLKVAEDRAARLLPRRAPGLSVREVARRPSGVIEVPGAAELTYPEVVTRRYDGPVTLLAGGAVLHDDVLLPESFTWPGQPRAARPSLVDIDRRVARLAGPMADPTALEGAYYHLDYRNPGHYGHLLTEGISKLWGWPEAKADDPGLRLLVRVHPRDAGRSRDRADAVLLRAFGIDEDDVCWVDGPARVSTLVGATPMLQAKPPYYVHPGLREVWGRLRDGLPRPVDAPRWPRIFVTRRGGHRVCHNGAEVERAFAAAGFHVLVPSAYSLEEQAAIFDGADVVAGFGGTGMFNLVYASGTPDVILLNQDAYDARNEALIAAALGSRVHSLVSAADVAHPEGGFSQRAFQSPWTFDFERNGAVLDGLLARYGR